MDIIFRRKSIEKSEEREIIARKLFNNIFSTSLLPSRIPQAMVHLLRTLLTFRNEKQMLIHLQTFKFEKILLSLILLKLNGGVNAHLEKEPRLNKSLSSVIGVLGLSQVILFVVC
jgi:hypothetical protein